MNFLYDAFVSFAWKDIRRARRLHEQLTELGYITWYAEKNMRGGDDMRKLLGEGLELSRYVFVIHSRHYSGAPWAERELSIATFDEVSSRTAKIVFLKFDDAPVPYDMRQKLYIDFSRDSKIALDQLVVRLDEASDGVIRGVADALLTATDINVIRSCAGRLSAIARLRSELLAVTSIAEILMKLPSNYHVTDSAAWALGDIGVWDIKEDFARAVEKTVVDCISTGNARLIDKIAFICGEMALSAKNLRLRKWALDLIKEHAASEDEKIRAPFVFTSKRITGQLD